jgi:uncharacterized Rossmann fold enzyme
MAQEFCEVENIDPAQHAAWLAKHGFQPSEEGTFPVAQFEGKDAASKDQLLENIRINVMAEEYESLYAEAYDERTFVMVCAGPSLAEHLEEIKGKAAQPDKYLVVCSNMTGGYLLDHGITPHVHFILDPLEKKRFDVAPGKTSREIQYWINVACNPAVFAELHKQGIKPYAFLADFDAEGKATQAVSKAMRPGQHGMMAIQGGTMAGLRAMNLADARGFRKIEYYGFDATVQVANGRARPYAYEKKRGEVIIEITCDLCSAKFDTTLIFQKQVNEFLKWRSMMPWLDIEIIGGGLISHSFEHLKERERAQPHSEERFTQEYKALQLELHSHGNYGVTGAMYTPTIFHAISQLAKRHGAVTVLDYGSSTGETMKAVKEHLWLPPTVEDRRYDPFVEEFAAEPEPADLVICTDVLEHVEPLCTKAVLDHIASLTKRIAFFSISLGKANKTLSDGRNAHINLPGQEWWLKELKKRFVLSEAKISKDGEVLLAVAQSVDDVREIMRARNAAA